jgi:hypothetical protein
VGVVLLDDFAEVANGRDAVRRLAEDGAAASLRDEHNADLVILFQTADLFIINSLTNEVREIDGIAHINDVNSANGTPDINEAFSVIEADASSEIFVHEVGHLLGCRHLKEDNPHQYANAYKFCSAPIVVNGQTVYCAGYTSTIMDGRGNANRLLRFSNPELSYMENATGTNEHNNAKMISLTPARSASSARMWTAGARIRRSARSPAGLRRFITTIPSLSIILLTFGAVQVALSATIGRSVGITATPSSICRSVRPQF